MKEVGHRRIVSMHNKMQGKYWKLDKHCLGGNCISKRCGKTKDQTPFFLKERDQTNFRFNILYVSRMRQFIMYLATSSANYKDYIVSTFNSK